jgi:predicted phosphoadenosine phosphosulfate sulfurtransferase
MTTRGAGTRRSFRKTPVSESVLDLARARVEHAYDLFDHIAVSFSGGKDSTCVLHVALDAARARGRLPLDVVFYDEEAIPLQTEEYVMRVGARSDVRLRWYCLPVKHRNACSRATPYWSPWAEEDRELWVRPLPKREAGVITQIAGYSDPGPQSRLSIPDLNGRVFPPREYGRVGLLMGIRAQESMIRLHNVLKSQADNYISPDKGRTNAGNLSRVKPIYDWTLEDVWTAPSLGGWDYNQAYRVMEMAGVPRGNQRCSPPFGEEPLGQLWTYSVCFPEVWDRMLYRVPGAAAAGRYATTELYSFGRDRVEKPEDVSWQDFLTTMLLRHGEGTRAQVAQRVAMHIKNHYKKTSDPILDVVPHPASGLSWRWLATIAARGDIKGRRHPGQETNRVPPDVMLARYREALVRERERGLVSCMTLRTRES